MAEARGATQAGDMYQEFSVAKADRSNFESHWDEIARRILPRQKGTILTTGSSITKGDKRTQEMFDATGALALEKFASITDSILTPRNSRWHSLRTGVPELDKLHSVKVYMEELTRILFQLRYGSNSGFASQNYESNISLGAFGTGDLFIDRLQGGGLRYKSVPISSLYILENHQGIVDTVYRTMYPTARQAIQQFGKQNLPDIMTNDAAKKRPDKVFEFLHVVKPRSDFDPTRADFRGMPWASFYITKEGGNRIVEEGGYRTMPYAVNRYVTGPGEVYGRSPAMLALPSIKTLNAQKKSVLKQGHRVTDPIILAHDDGALGTFSLRPGAINTGAMTAEGKRLVDVLPTGNLSVGFEMMSQERDVINDAFLVTLFQILTETPTMTATEVIERTREKGILLSPTMGRQESEKLGPMILREIDVVEAQGLLPEMPPELVEAEGEFEVVYDSPLSRAQKAEEASGFFRTMEVAGTYINLTQDPSPLDHINMDAAMPDIMAINAMPAKWQNTEEAILAIREGRQEEADDAKTLEALPSVAGAMKAGK